MQCIEEAHRPVDCATVAKWILKNSSESENTNWILANSKPCPNCKRPIEKNTGCNHMTCSAPCCFQFCWLCLGAWSKHRDSSCNGYQEAGKANNLSEMENRRRRAKASLDRYLHFYERWASNQKSKEKAMADLKEFESHKISDLGKRLVKRETDLIFILEAWRQIIECRRVLKWSYAYGYYIPEDHYARKQFFEHIQGDAEFTLERLHHVVEKDLESYFDLCPDSSDYLSQLDEFSKFRMKLRDMTRVAQRYFGNLVRCLENGLADVTTQGCSSSSQAPSEAGRQEAGAALADQPWPCDRCSYSNPATSLRCAMCLGDDRY